MKNFKSILATAMAAVMLIACMCLTVSAETKPVGQFIFDSTMPLEAWQKHATCQTVYDQTEDCFKLLPNGGNVVMTNGHNAGIIEYFGDADSLLKDYPTVKIGVDGKMWCKIRIKGYAGMDMTDVAYQALTFSVGDETKGLASWTKVTLPVSGLEGIEDGEWHDYVIDLSKQGSRSEASNGTESWFATNSVDLAKLMIGFSKKTNGVTAPIYLKYICFFDTEAEANAFTLASEAESSETAPATDAPAVSSDNVSVPDAGHPITSVLAVALVTGVTAGVVVVNRRKKNR